MVNIREYCGLVGTRCGTSAGRLWVVLALMAALMFPAIAVFASAGQSAMAASGCHEQVFSFQNDVTPDVCAGLSCNHTVMDCGTVWCSVADFPRVAADALPKAFVAVNVHPAKTALHIGRATVPLLQPPITATSA